MRGSRQLRRTPEGALVEVEGGGASRPPTPSAQARLQRAVGNQGLQQALAEAAARPRESDPHERAADACAAGGAAAQPASGGSRGETSRAERDLLARLGSGQALPSALRADLEGRLGFPLDGVRVHRGARPAELADQAHARAFTTGEQIVLGAGASENDAALIAHESAHVAQQASVAGAPAVQCQPAPAADATNYDALLLALQQWLLHPLSEFNPPAIRAELLSLALGGVPFGTIELTRLASSLWSSNRSERADSVWRPDGKPEIGVSDELLRDFALYDQDRDLNVASGWAVVRTLAHELRHLNRFKERESGKRGATIAEKRFERTATAIAAATPSKLKLEEYIELPPGRELHHDTVYPYEEVLARLDEVPLIEREYDSLKASSGGAAGEGDREHIEAVLCETGYNAQSHWQDFVKSCTAGKAGLSAADIPTAIAEIEAEIAKRYKTSQAPKRFWDLIKAGRFSSRYVTRIDKRIPTPGGAPGEYIIVGEKLIVFLPLVFP